MALDDPSTARIIAFLAEIGIPVSIARLAEDGFLPGIAVRDGGLVIGPDRPFHPGDLLHEAGHIAVTDPARRTSLCEVVDDPAEEMAALAWSYAASVAIGLEAEMVFHADGYRGGGAQLAESFREGRGVGVPMLEWYGMAARAGEGAPFPAMRRWLR